MLATSEKSIEKWLAWAGFRFDPFRHLDAAGDPRLGDYLVGHRVITQVWGEGLSWVFAPLGGGKTALRIAVMQACWVGQETNRPFAIPYIPPYSSWGHATPSLEEHLEALAHAGGTALFLVLAHRPRWFFRLDRRAQQRVRRLFQWTLPGPLPSLLGECRRGIHALRRALAPSFVLRDPPDPDVLRQWCDALARSSEESPEEGSPSPGHEGWGYLCRILLEDFGFPSVFVLVDGVDSAPETAEDPEAVVHCLAPLLGRAEEWASRRIFIKCFLPEEAYPVLRARFSTLVDTARTTTIRWDPGLLAEVIRRRVYVATEGAFGSLDAVCTPALQDLETNLAKVVYPIPREMLMLTRRVIEEHVQRAGEERPIEEEDVQQAIEWYFKQSVQFTGL